jgi:hypothetical protein
VAGYYGELLVFVSTAIFATMAYEMKLGTFQQPGAGLWPFMICVVIIALAVVAGLENYRQKIRASFKLANMRHSLMAMVSIAIYAFTIGILGYITPTVLLLAFWLRVIGGESWRLTLILSLSITALFYVVFSYLLGVPFPPEFFLD